MKFESLITQELVQGFCPAYFNIQKYFFIRDTKYLITNRVFWFSMRLMLQPSCVVRGRIIQHCLQPIAMFLNVVVLKSYCVCHQKEVAVVCLCFDFFIQYWLSDPIVLALVIQLIWVKKDEHRDTFRIALDLAIRQKGGVGRFFLSSRNLGLRLGFEHTRAWRNILKFKQRRLIEEVKRGTQGINGSASEFKWLLPR